MPALRSSLEVSSPPDVVWELISCFEHWPSWGVTITEVEPATGPVQPGSTGRVKTITGLWLPFEITEVVPGETWSWKVAGIRATGHHIEPTDDGCRVTFTAPMWAPFYLPVLTKALRLIERQSADS